MRPIEYPWQNLPERTSRVLYGAGQDEVEPLPALIDSEGVVTSVWDPTDEERDIINEGGAVLVSLRTFGGAPQPIAVVAAGGADTPRLPVPAHGSVADILGWITGQVAGADAETDEDFIEKMKDLHRLVTGREGLPGDA